MKMKKGIYLGLLLLISIAPANGRDLRFVCCLDLKEFLSQHVPQDKQDGFVRYYQEVSQKIKQADSAEQRKAFAHLHKTALSVLKQEHPEWHKSIQVFFGDPLVTIHTDKKWEIAQKATDLFLSRYGALHVFYGTKTEVSNGCKQEGFWQSMVNSFLGLFGKHDCTIT